jgi:hypothetical protein
MEKRSGITVKCKISTMEEIYSTTGSQMYEKKTLQLVF